ncbi:hypothetical protein GCM10028786_00570 [Flaviaesturariibacter terrae]
MKADAGCALKARVVVEKGNRADFRSRQDKVAQAEFIDVDHDFLIKDGSQVLPEPVGLRTVRGRAGRSEGDNPDAARFEPRMAYRRAGTKGPVPNPAAQVNLRPAYRLSGKIAILLYALPLIVY